jgi:DHA1 family tetracycline resistance protein-like MFS transporter
MLSAALMLVGMVIAARVTRLPPPAMTASLLHQTQEQP